MTFQPGSELVVGEAELRREVQTCLARLRAGEHPSAVERERVDLKEEAGRRGQGGVLLPAEHQSTRAADQLADEVACMANTPGGGALIVGVEDATGSLLGCELDAEWLRHQVYRRIDVAPQVEAVVERGLRLLVLLVSEAREPVEDTGNRMRWRVSSHCVPVDRAGWWTHRQGRAGWDEMAQPTSRALDDASQGALAVARRYARDRATTDGLEQEPDAELLRRIGVLTPEGFLTQSGALMFCPAPRSWITWARLDVLGGEVLAAEDDYTGLSLLEQVAAVEALIEAANDRVTLSGAFAERRVRLLPPRTAREVVMNGIVHRDFHQSEATTVTWVVQDSALEVVSPGGFVGGVTPGNALSQRFSRSPALADAFRALGLVDKQGIGVDRMYREMVVLGHRPPLIVEEPGPRVRVRLTGGRPVVPVMNLIDRIEPRARQSDVQVALIVHTLLHDPFTTPDLLAAVLQRTTAEAREALEVAASCMVHGEPLIAPYRDVWLLSSASLAQVLVAAEDATSLRRRGVLSYRAPDSAGAARVVEQWIAVHDRISSGDYAALTGLTYAGSRRVLERLAAEGVLVRGEVAGRNAHFLPVRRMPA